MKTTQLLVVATLLVASASISFAGPGAQYWQQRRNPPVTHKEQATAVGSQTAPAVTTPGSAQTTSCQGCTSCTTKS